MIKVVVEDADEGTILVTDVIAEETIYVQSQEIDSIQATSTTIDYDVSTEEIDHESLAIQSQDIPEDSLVVVVPLPGTPGPPGPQGEPGPRGPAGPGGSGGGTFIQMDNPGMTTPGQWWQTDASGNLVTLWVETG